MSRETLKSKIIEVLKEVEAKQIDYIVRHSVCGQLDEVAVDDNNTICFGKDILRKYVAIINLKEFLENDEYDPFLDYSAKYPAGLYPRYPEGVTIWEIDDTDIRIIEDDPKMFINDVLGEIIIRGMRDNILSAIQPSIIRNNYISIIQRCVFEDREKKKSENKRNDGSETDINPSDLLP